MGKEQATGSELWVLYEQIQIPSLRSRPQAIPKRAETHAGRAGGKAGVVTSSISMLESSQKFPNLDMLFVLAEALGVSPSELVAAMENALTAASSKTRRA